MEEYLFKKIKEWGKGNCGAEERGGRRTKVGRGAGIDETGRRCEEKKKAEDGKMEVWATRQESNMLTRLLML